MESDFELAFRLQQEEEAKIADSCAEKPAPAFSKYKMPDFAKSKKLPKAKNTSLKNMSFMDRVNAQVKAAQEQVLAEQGPIPQEEVQEKEEEEDWVSAERKIILANREKAGMRSTPDGQAWLFTEAVYSHAPPAGATPVAVDDMVFMASKFVEKLREFEDLQKCNDIALAWHWTSPKSYTTISSHGLLTRTDMSESRISGATFHGTVYGDGVYVANNPKSFANYGEICLLCIVLPGRRVFAKDKLKDEEEFDTRIGNKVQHDRTTMDHPSNEYVLKTSAQIIPVYHVMDQSDAVVEWVKNQLRDIVKRTFGNFLLELSTT